MTVATLVAVQGPTGPAFADASGVGSASNGSPSLRNSVSVDRPAGTAAGHVMVGTVVSTDDKPGFTAPAGWTLVRQDTVKGQLRQAVYVKVAGAGEPGSYTWTVGGQARRLAGGITSFAGVDTTQPVDAVSGSKNGSGTAVPAPGITTSVANTLLLHLAAVAAEGTITPPAGMAEQWEAASASPSDNRDVVVSESEALQAAAGPTGGRVATASQAGASIGVLLALRPALIDATAPETTITFGPSGTVTNAFATFDFSASEPATFQCRLDGSDPAPCTSPVTYTNLADGAHTFSVKGTDTAGNADPTPAVRQWTVDTSGTDPVIAGAGDIAYCGNDNDEATAQLLDNIPGTVFTLGDNVYPDGAYTDFVNCYGPTWGREKPRTLPVAGNHEYATTPGDGYFSYFGAAAGQAGKGYYDYTVGAWHVIVLNSNCSAVGGCGAGSPEEQWLRKVLAASPADCTVAMWHHPRFSSGSTHGSDATFQAFWQALYDYGADVVLNGHEHVYERFGFQTADGTADAVYGLRQFTVGTGGRSSYSFATALPNSEVRARPYGVLKMTLHADSYDWEFIPVAGQTFTDHGTSACHGAPATTPPPPPPPPPPSGSGAITVVGSTSDGASTARSGITLTRPAGTAAGQVMVAAVSLNDDATVSAAPTGWTLVREDSVNPIRQVVYVRVIGGTEPSSYTWTLSGSRRVAGGITAYSGVDTTTPVDTSAASLNPSGTSVAAPSITTTRDGAMVVELVAVNAEGTVTPPDGMTEAWEAASPNATSTRDVLAESSCAGQALAGATGSRVATASLPGASVGVLLALRPAV
jgi:hypothetical protein